MTEQLTEEFPAADHGTQPAPPPTIRIAWAPVPKVNLLPVEILEARQFQRTLGLLGAAVVAAVLAAGGGLFWAQQQVGDANDQLLAAQTRVTTLQAQEAKYAAVPKIIAEVDAAKAARTSAMGADVLWYRTLIEVDGARPAGLVLDSLTLTLNGASTAATATSDPLSLPGIGTLTATGSALRYDTVSSWLEALNKLSGISSSSMPNATRAEDTGLITFSSGAVLDPDSLSGRYDKEAG